MGVLWQPVKQPNVSTLKETHELSSVELKYKLIKSELLVINVQAHVYHKTTCMKISQIKGWKCKMIIAIKSDWL